MLIIKSGEQTKQFVRYWAKGEVVLVVSKWKC